MWPIAGADLAGSAMTFLDVELGLGPSFCTLRAGDVVPVRPGRETRDTVRSTARNLAGKPTMGMRLEVPEHLRPSLRNLEGVSYGTLSSTTGLWIWYWILE